MDAGNRSNQAGTSGARPTFRLVPREEQKPVRIVGHETDLPLPFPSDRTRVSDPWLVVEWAPESQRVAHDVGNRVVVVKRDLIRVNLFNRTPARNLANWQVVCEFVLHEAHNC